MISMGAFGVLMWVVLSLGSLGLIKWLYGGFEGGNQRIGNAGNFLR